MSTKFGKLKSGSLVVLHQTKLDGSIYARRRPQGTNGNSPNVVQDILITTIPSGTRALYMSTQEDAFNSALRAKGRGPYGYTPVNTYYHFILWEGRPVWVSSNEATLEVLHDPKRPNEA